MLFRSCEAQKAVSCASLLKVGLSFNLLIVRPPFLRTHVSVRNNINSPLTDSEDEKEPSSGVGLPHHVAAGLGYRMGLGGSTRPYQSPFAGWLQSEAQYRLGLSPASRTEQSFGCRPSSVPRQRRRVPDEPARADVRTSRVSGTSRSIGEQFTISLHHVHTKSLCNVESHQTTTP